MTVYKTGRSTDYANAQTKRQYQSRKVNVTADAIEQFERMANGLAPAIVEGDRIAWVADTTLTPEDCQWCRQTAAEIARDADIARRHKPKPGQQGIGAIGLAHSRARHDAAMAREAAIARVLAIYPDATCNQIVVTTGLQRLSVLKSEAWQMAQMGRTVKHE